MKLFVSKLLGVITQFFYPSFCLHCNHQIFGKEKWICQVCIEQIEWMDMMFTCQACGRRKEHYGRMQCNLCRIRPRNLMPFGSCFSPEGPAYSLYTYMRVYENEEVAKLLASFLLLKWKKLAWAFPDVITPIPHSNRSMFSLKKQPNYLLAKALSKVLATRFKPILTLREKGIAFGYQAKTFLQGNLTNRKVLLISDVVDDSDTLQFAQDAISIFSPQALYTLALFDRR